MPAIPDNTLAEIDGYFEEAVDTFKTPGISYGIVTGEGLVHAGGFGWSEVREGIPTASGTRPSASSVSRVASMTKSFTAAAILRLRDEGRLHLDVPASAYLPELAGVELPTSDSACITIRGLLTMSAGLVTDNPWGDRQEAMTAAQFSDLLRGGLSFTHVPGTGFEYSNTSYACLGQIVANVSGTDYMSYVMENSWCLCSWTAPLSRRCRPRRGGF